MLCQKDVYASVQVHSHVCLVMLSPGAVRTHASSQICTHTPLVTAGSSLLKAHCILRFVRAAYMRGLHTLADVKGVA